MRDIKILIFGAFVGLVQSVSASNGTWQIVNYATQLMEGDKVAFVWTMNDDDYVMNDDKSSTNFRGLSLIGESTWGDPREASDMPEDALICTLKPSGDSSYPWLLCVPSTDASGNPIDAYLYMKDSNIYSSSTDGREGYLRIVADPSGVNTHFKITIDYSNYAKVGTPVYHTGSTSYGNYWVKYKTSTKRVGGYHQNSSHLWPTLWVLHEPELYDRRPLIKIDEYDIEVTTQNIGTQHPDTSRTDDIILTFALEDGESCYYKIIANDPIVINANVGADEWTLYDEDAKVRIPAGFSGTLNYYLRHQSGAESDVYTNVLNGERTTTSVESLVYGLHSSSNPVKEYYDVTGRRVADATQSGIYIMRQNGQTSKIVVR